MSEMVHGGRHHNLRRTRERDERAEHHAEEMQRSEFGGLNFGAAFFGWLVSNSVAVLLVSLLSALGSAVALTTNNAAGQAANNAATVGITSAVLLLIALGIAYYAGGYVAGRMSRFDGGRQGLGVWIIGIAMAVVLAFAGLILGASFNVLQQLSLPSIPVDGQNFTIGGLITLMLLLVVTALAAIGGGKAGERYHHKVDEAGRVDVNDEQ